MRLLNITIAICLFFASYLTYACDDCMEPTVDAQAGDVMYMASEGDQLQLDTRPMTIPAGFEMVRVEHPPLYTCTEVPQPDTFELKAKASTKKVVRKVTKARVQAIQNVEVVK